MFENKRILYCVIFVFYLLSVMSCRSKNTLQSGNKYGLSIDSVMIFLMGTRTFIDKGGELNLTPTFVTPTAIEIKDILHDSLINSRIYDTTLIYKMYRTFIVNYADKKEYASGTDNRCAIIFFNSDKINDTISVINKNQALLNNKSLLIYRNNIVEFLLSNGVVVPDS